MYETDYLLKIAKNKEILLKSLHQVARGEAVAVISYKYYH